MLWIALAAAQMSMPVAIGVSDVRAVFSVDDMPEYVQHQGITRFVLTYTTVGPDGTARYCSVDPSSGDPQLDRYTCAIILKRARFEPAKWVDGTASYAVLRVPVTWTMGAPPSQKDVDRAYPPDMEITVNQLPKGARSPAHIALMIAVDENGKVVSCGEWLPSFKGAHPKRFPELVEIACREIISAYAAPPAKDPAGRAVRSIQTAGVVFTLAGKPDR